MKISVAIPTSNMPNGEALFRRCLDSLWDQSFQDFEIVVTDNSDDNSIRAICSYYGAGINYYRNPRKGMALNTNDAIMKSRGDIIKVLYMDDFLIDDEALETISERFEGRWLVNGCIHVDSYGVIPRDAHVPSWNDRMHEGVNTIGSPSVMAILNDDPMLFDEELTWLLDCDYYRRMRDRWGYPVIVPKPLTAIGIHDGQATNTMGDQRKQQECLYMMEKYKQNKDNE